MLLSRAVYEHRWSAIGFAVGLVVFTAGAIRVHGGDGGSIRSVGAIIIIGAIVRVAYESSVDRDRRTHQFLRCQQRTDSALAHPPRGSGE